MHSPDFEGQIAAIAALQEPVRRGLYLYVSGRSRDVGRDEAARALRISRALAAFHLDKLAALGLLETSYRRLTARRGPGAGRPAKLYRRSAQQLELSLPRRRYELAARVFAQALTATASPAATRALRRVAAQLGRSLGAAARHAGARRGRNHVAAGTLTVLDACGYEPLRTNGDIQLRNCPFEALANECRPLVCGMNLALLQGVVRGAGVRRVRVELDPRPGSCCVVLRTAHPRR